ncbi:HAMP domain-containing protein, partial [Escherichia coli]
MIVLIVIAVTGGVALGWWISRSLTGPLATGVQAAQRIAEGDLTVELNVDGRDETAQLLGALANMKDNLV